MGISKKIVNAALAEELEKLYIHFNRREYVHPDPLEFLYDYPEVRDREIVGLMAASLAYGNVKQILKSISLILAKMGPHPHEFLMNETPQSLRACFKNFKHRWHTGDDIAWALLGIQKTVQKWGSLETAFCTGFLEENLLNGLSHLVGEITKEAPRLRMNFFPAPARGSACKRLHLYLRWMVRKDGIDPGGWEGIPASKLIIPLDTHMHRIGKKLRLTRRNQGDIRTALEITDAFRKMVPEDPVRYDFALTRLGIQRINFQASKNSIIIRPVAPQIL